MITTKNGRKMYSAVNSFRAIGKAKVNERTFEIDKVSDSKWQYNKMNLGVQVAEGQTVFAQAMGGFSQVKDSFVYNVHSKEDSSNMFNVAFKDRLNPAITETIANRDFFRVGLEHENGEIQTKRFLHEYDMIAYVKEHLQDGMTIVVSGDLTYRTYNDATQVQKEIKSVYLHRSEFVEKVEAPEFGCFFEQEILLDEYSVDKKSLKDRNLVGIDAKVLNYQKEFTNAEGKGFVIPFPVRFMFDVSSENGDKMVTKLFKVDKKKGDGIRSLIVHGHIIEGHAEGKATKDDLTQEVLDLIELGLFSEEEALKQVHVRGDRVFEMHIDKPAIVKDSDDKENMSKPRLKEITNTGALGIDMNDEIHTQEDMIVPTESAPKTEEATTTANEPVQAPAEAPATSTGDDLDALLNAL